MHKEDLLSDPLKQFEHWYEEARKSGEESPDAMTLATANAKGCPSARVVLYKGIDKEGFLIFTNYNSRKSKELLENPHAALVFYWPKLYRQVRIEGKVKKITKAESQHYFNTRPYESKISAWVSEQSQEIPSREYLLERHIEGQQKFAEGEEVTCPDFWGGFRLVPDRMEFWLGAEHRLHDRFCYEKVGEQWKIKRLAP
ncbi:pyridoxamine 5'-phosphate oxidase [Candidiatus Paracoxiella cheracis]|uniref:pyridoxamine 5'-phosphate oxidase n=1 Tax=Candidiatus Paracoxiella cheracis TaxID=3405120 RepID=UPI003BF552C1